MAPRKQNKDTKKGTGAQGQGGKSGVKNKGMKWKESKAKTKPTETAKKRSKDAGAKSKGTTGAGRVVKRGVRKEDVNKKKAKKSQNVKASTSTGRGKGVVQSRPTSTSAKTKKKVGSDSTKAKSVKAKLDKGKTRQQTRQTDHDVNKGKKVPAGTSGRGGLKRKRKDEDVTTRRRPSKRAKKSIEPPAAPVEMRELSPIERLSLEVLCKIIQFLPLRDALKLQCLSQTLREAVRLHLRICKSINFTEGEVCGSMSMKMSDKIFGGLVHRCPDLTNIYGLHPSHLCKPHCKDQDHVKLNDCYTIKGMIIILKNCKNLKGIETSHIFLLEAILLRLPHIKILGLFKNRGGRFPAIPGQSFCLRQNPPITKLHLTGVILPELPRMDYVIYLALKWVKFTNLNPFREFIAPRLHTFVMNNCSGPTNALKYVPLVTRLAAASNLTRLELVRVPFLGAFFQHVVEDTWRLGGFRQLKKILISACKHATEIDMGHLLLTAAESISEVYIQPSLTKDSLFLALSMAEPDFPKIDTVSLGYVDPFPVEKGKWEPLQLALAGLADAGSSEHAALITDVGIQHVGKDFTFVKNLNAYNCPHLINPRDWLTPDGMCFAQLRSLHLNRCHAIKLQSFCEMLAELPAIETVHLERMFREPPKGCSRVGLSAGTGLGVSSAFVANQEPAPAAAAAAAAVPVPPPAPEANAAPAALDGAAKLDQVNNTDGHDSENGENSGKKPKMVDKGSSGKSSSEENSGSMGKVMGTTRNKSDDMNDKSGSGKSCSNCGKFYPEVKNSELVGRKIDVDSQVETGAEKLGTENKDTSTKANSTTGKERTEDNGVIREEKDMELTKNRIVSEKNSSESMNFESKMSDNNASEIGCVPDVENPSGGGLFAKVTKKDEGNQIDCVADQKVPGSVDTMDNSCETLGGATNDLSSYHGKGKRPMGCKAFFKKKAKSSIVPGTSGNEDKKETGGNDSNAGGEKVLIDVCPVLGVGNEDSSRRRSGEDVERGEVGEPMGDEIRGVDHSNAQGMECDDCEFKNESNRDVGNLSPQAEPDAKLTVGSAENMDSVDSVGGMECSGNADQSNMKSKCQDSGSGSVVTDCCHECQGVKQDTQNRHQSPAEAREADQTSSNDPKDADKAPVQADSSQNGCHLEDKANSAQRGWDSILNSSAERNMSQAKQLQIASPMDVDDDDLPVVRRVEDQPKPPMEEPSSKNDEKVGPTGNKSGEVNGENLGTLRSSGAVANSSSVASVPKTDRSTSSAMAGDSSPCASSTMSTDKKSEVATKSDKIPSSCSSDACAQETSEPTPSHTKDAEGSEHPTSNESSDSPASPEPVEARKTVGTQTSYDDGGDISSPSGSGPSGSGEYASPEPSPQVQGSPSSAESTPRRRDIPVFRCLYDVDDEELEEDARQILTVKSRTLVSLTLHMVGITDLVVVDSPQIKVLHGTACRVLKTVKLKDAPKLTRVTFAQCTKLDHMSVIRDVTRLTPTSDRFVFLRPMAKFDAKCIGEELFRVGNGYHGCMIQDHSLDPGTTQIQKARFIEKIKLVSSISFHILRLDKYPIFKKTPSSEQPWGRNLHNLTGTSPDDSPWEAMTDIPWLPHLENLSTKEEDKDAVDIIEEKLGLHKLYTMEHIWPFGCFEGLAEAIGHAEAAESSLFPRTIGVYINTCDVSGIPTPDDYV